MGRDKRRGTCEARAAAAEARIRAEGAEAAARNMVGMTDAEVYEYVDRGAERAAGCLAVTVCGIGLAAVALLGLLLAGPCRRETRPGPESLAANIAAGIYPDELADAGGR